ncbi:TetR/AcrR family transcriptional regulator [Streptomyces sp. NBC_00006]|uniref:TetR/AcrR family transcriptional regulator n=1 Tax=unclassified Streptomyces TaxID=2593676 RepID=UPI00224D2094|nr:MULTISPECIES: TetR/AcrR family transcriptional regulator [unclassified Streptomyces]MCX4832220.1 TetR/AcrR family transcriptional regulator [Streptomyces sp. NBC_01016]MCX5536743.1 TetR/AcrR family transcriptional regulator [Streptomyces sp. NBC_00006]
MPTDTTRAALLDAAERLFLTKGYEQVSVRAVNAAAGMNPAAVHYHFGAKEDLVAALLQSRLGPLWAQPLADVERRTADGETPRVEEFVDVLVRPLDELTRTPHGRMLLHLLARVVLSRRELPFDERWFGHRPWSELLCAARPDLSRAQAGHRLRMTFDLLLQLYGEPQLATAELGGTPRPPAEAVIAFVAAGLNAPQ